VKQNYLMLYDGYIDIIQILIKHNKEPNIETKNGNTPL